MTTVFHVWHQGDPSVGDGTLTAKVEVDIGEDMNVATKESLVRAFSLIWDARPKMVHIMTGAEYDKYTSSQDEAEDPHPTTLEEASAEVSKAVYAATAAFERLEGDGLIMGNGHHARQKLAQAAVEDLKARWKDLP
jgi:phosphotransacetylase